MPFSLRARARSLLFPLFLAGGATLAAQPPSATFRPTLIETFAANYAYSGAADLERGGPLGEIAIHHAEASFAGRRPLAEKTQLTYGAALSVNRLEADAGIPLPDRLGELTVNLGLTHAFTPQWRLSAFVRPGFYSDLEDFSGKAFNAPVLVLASFAQSQDLVWLFGVSANAFSERAVFPLAGVRWKFAPEWTFNLGFPRAGFTWETSPDLSLHAGFSVQGGSYRVTENLGVPAPGIARLANTYLSYRELRFGAGATWKLAEKLSFELEAGVATDRKFEYFDRNYTLNGQAAPYVSLALKGRF